MDKLTVAATLAGATVTDRRGMADAVDADRIERLVARQREVAEDAAERTCVFDEPYGSALAALMAEAATSPKGAS